MGQPVFDASSYEVEGETQALTTTAAFVAVKPNFQEVSLHCSSDWKLALTPALLHAIVYDGTNYTEYKDNVTDRSSSTHLPLDGATTSYAMYLGTSQQSRAFWIDMGSNVQSTGSRALDVNYQKETAITAFATHASGTTVTAGSHGASDGDLINIYDAGPYNGQWTVANTAANTFTITKTFTYDVAAGRCVFFEDVTGDSDGTSGSTTLDQDGLYEFTLPTAYPQFLGTPNAPLFSHCFWISFTPNGTLSSPVDLDNIIPAYRNTNYIIRKAGIEYQISVNPAKVGGLEVLSVAGTPTLDIGWIKS